MGDHYPSVVPSFGLHPWFVAERTPNWMTSLKELLDTTPSAAVGEIGLDKGPHGKDIDFRVQAKVFRQQLELAKQLKRPASIHCVRAFGDLLEIMKSVGPFPAGVILHSYLGSAEMVPEFAKLGAHFSFSGFLMSMKESRAKKILKTVLSDRILQETDAPDALPRSNTSGPLFLIEGDDSAPLENELNGGCCCSDNSSQDTSDPSKLPKGTLNHPANIHSILAYVASLLELSKEEVADVSLGNAMRLFSYEGSKIAAEVQSRS